MRSLGIAALLLTFLSFVFWIINWVFFNFFGEMFGYNNRISLVVRGFGFLGVLTEYLAIALLSIGLIMFAKYISKK